MTIYPLVIVFVILSLFDRVIGWRKSIYHWALNLTLVFALIDGLNAAGIHFHPLNQLLTAYLPFYKLTMGWVVPAICGTQSASCCHSSRRKKTYDLDKSAVIHTFGG